MENDGIEIHFSEDIVILAESTKPEDYELEDWIREWAEFGLEVSQLASMKKDALDVAANIEEAAVLKFADLVDEETQAFAERLGALEQLTDVNDQQAGFGKVLKELKDFVNPKHTDSVLFKYKQSLEQVTDENGLFRKAVRLELAKEGGISQKLQDIAEKMGLEEKEKEVSRKSTLKGDLIEDTLKLNLESLFPGNDLTFTKLTNTTGEIKNSKKGDIILNFGTDHVLHDRPIIYEMKSDDRFFLDYEQNTETSATHYLGKAMENRVCKVGIFVMDKATALEQKGWKRSLTVAENKIFVVWDPDDPSTDWLLTVATYIAIGRNKPPKDVIDPNERSAIIRVTKELEAEATRYSKMRTEINSILSNSNKLSENIRKGSDGIQRCIKHAKTTLKVLQMDSTELTHIEFEDVDLESGVEEE